MNTTPRLTVDLPLHRAKRVAQAILPHVSTDDVTPILTAAQFENGHLVGTDRYSVGQIRLQDSVKPPERMMGGATRIREESAEHFQERLQEHLDEHEVRYFDGVGRIEKPVTFLVPRDALQRVSTLNASFLLGGKVTERTARVRLEAWDPQERGIPEKKFVGYDRVDVVLLERGTQVFRQTFLGIIGNFPPVHRLMDEWKPAEVPVAMNFTATNLAKVTKFADPREFIRITAGAGDKPARLAPTRLDIGDDFTALLQPNLVL